MAPGSSIRPATWKITTSRPGRQPQTIQKKTPQATRDNASAPWQLKKQQQPRKRDGVGTRSTTIICGDLDANEPITELSPYHLLLDRKIQLRRAGMVDEALRIQAAVNVGMLLFWNENEVIRTVEQLERYAERNFDVPQKQATKGRLTGAMMEVGGEEEVLGFERNVSEGRVDGWERLRFLRESFAPLIERRGCINTVGEQQPGTGVQKLGQVKLFAPLLLIKIQAALSIAFCCGWNARQMEKTTTERVGDNDMLSGATTNNFDISSFKQKTIYLLRVPNKQCGEEVLRHLRCSKLGRKRFGDVDVCGRTIAAMPGIERPLTSQEKVRLLYHVNNDLAGGREMVKVLVEVFGRGEAMPKVENTSGWVEGGLSKRVIAELSDEAYLLLNSVYTNRHGIGVLVPDYVLDGEEEEEEEGEEPMTEDENEDENEDDELPPHQTGGSATVRDTLYVAGGERRAASQVRLKVRALAQRASRG